LFLDNLRLTREQMKECSAKEASMAIGIAQVICNGTQ